MDLLLYDTTLRDGTQREGLSLSVEDAAVQIRLPAQQLPQHVRIQAVSGVALNTLIETREKIGGIDVHDVLVSIHRGPISRKEKIGGH